MTVLCLNKIYHCDLSAGIFPYRTARANLRSASDTTRLVVPNSIKLLKSAEHRTFCYVAPRMLNELPRKIGHVTVCLNLRKH